MALELQLRSVAIIEEAFLRWQFRVSVDKQIDFLEDMIRLLSDGIPLHGVLQHIQEVGESLGRSVARVLLRKLDEGLPVDMAMESMFRFDIAAAIGAARESGDLSQTGLAVLQRLREQQEASKGAIAQLGRPILYIVVAATLYAVFSLQVWPSFLEAGFSLHPLADGIHSAGQFILNFWHFGLGLIVTLFLTIRVLLRRWTGPARLQMDKVFPFSLYRGIHAANTLEQIGTLLSAGHEPRSTIEALETHATPWIGMYLERMRHKLDEGSDLSEMLAVGLMMRRDMARLRLLADFRDLRATIAMTGVAARELVLARLRRTARILESLGLAFVALSLVAQVGAIYLTALNIQEQVQKSL